MDWEAAAHEYYDALVKVSRGKTWGSTRALREVRRLGSPNERFMAYLRSVNGAAMTGGESDARVVSVKASVHA